MIASFVGVAALSYFALDTRWSASRAA